MAEEKPTKPPIKINFHIQNKSVASVANELLRGDISDCIIGDVKHTAELLTHILVLQDLAPGFMDEMISFIIPNFIKKRDKQILDEYVQKRANEEGFGDELREAIEAGRHPKRKGYMAKMVALQMKVGNVNQNQAIRMAAEQLGLEEDNIRRTVTRAKKRDKK